MDPHRSVPWDSQQQQELLHASLLRPHVHSTRTPSPLLKLWYLEHGSPHIQHCLLEPSPGPTVPVSRQCLLCGEPCNSKPLHKQQQLLPMTHPPEPTHALTGNARTNTRQHCDAWRGNQGTHRKMAQHQQHQAPALPNQPHPAQTNSAPPQQDSPQRNSMLDACNARMPSPSGKNHACKRAQVCTGWRAKEPCCTAAQTRLLCKPRWPVGQQHNTKIGAATANCDGQGLGCPVQAPPVHWCSLCNAAALFVLLHCMPSTAADTSQAHSLRGNMPQET